MDSILKKNLRTRYIFILFLFKRVYLIAGRYIQGEATGKERRPSAHNRNTAVLTELRHAGTVATYRP